MTNLTGSLFDKGLKLNMSRNSLDSEEQENSEQSNILQFPKKEPENPIDPIMKANVENIKDSSDKGELEFLYAVCIDNKGNIVVRLSGSIRDAKTYSLVSSALGVMYQKSLNELSDVFLPGGKRG
jgi:hypothetical protein